MAHPSGLSASEPAGPVAGVKLAETELDVFSPHCCPEGLALGGLPTAEWAGLPTSRAG